MRRLGSTARRGAITGRISSTSSRIFTTVSTEALTGHSRHVGTTYQSPTGGSVHSASPHAQQTALRLQRPLGSAEVTHPFHPLRGQRFVVLKLRRVSGVETLSLRHPDLGSFAMIREWTDWAPPGAQTATTALPLLMNAFGLAALAGVVEFILGTATTGVDQ